MSSGTGSTAAMSEKCLSHAKSRTLRCIAFCAIIRPGKLTLFMPCRAGALFIGRSRNEQVVPCAVHGRVRREVWARGNVIFFHTILSALSATDFRARWKSCGIAVRCPCSACPHGCGNRRFGLQFSIMRFLRQFFIIIAVSFVGEVLAHFVPLPIPASIYGLVLMFAALKLGLFPLGAVKETGAFLLDIMPVMFIPPAIAILANLDVLKAHWWQLLVAAAVSTVLVMGVTGVVTQAIIRAADRRRE